MFKSRISAGTCVVLSLPQIIAFDVSNLLFPPIVQTFLSIYQNEPGLQRHFVDTLNRCVNNECLSHQKRFGKTHVMTVIAQIDQ